MMGRECCVNLYFLLSHVLQNEVPGEVVELGCYRGFTGILFQKTLDAYSSCKELHLFDSFSGLPPKSEKDRWESSENMRRCDFLDNQRVGEGWFESAKEEVIENFRENGCRIPFLHEGWFEETLPKSLPEKVCFAHLDGDFYDSTLSGLEEVYPRLQPGGVLVLDDYCDEAIHGKKSALPGVKRACDEFFLDKPESPQVLWAISDYQACVTKLEMT